MLIPFPFAFLTGAWGFGMAAAITGNRDLRTVSRYLVPTGLAAGLVAAVPGVIDYVGRVPPQSSAKSRATKHALLNVTALALFGAGYLLRRRRTPQAVPLVAETLGAAALSVAGYMGGTLSYRNQIGVDHRYADAGKWKESAIESATPEALASAAADLGINQMKLVHSDGARIVVARTEDGPAAFSDRCTHRGGPLSDGALACGIVQCPWHGSQFDVRSGAVKCGPATEAISAYTMPPASDVRRA
jgi:nitrite reductase/ring-hydroxylating ferredoxin subunit/uncharacterized membrane protein